MCEAVVEELCDSLSGGLCAFGLGGCNGAKGDKHGGVYIAGIVEQGAHNLLNVSNASCREQSREVSGRAVG